MSTTTATSKKHIVIVGAGFSGLAAAALLAKQGFKVTVLEKNDQPGGRARVYKKDGFVFDMGPSWYLMPEVFETFFKRLDHTVKDHYELTRIDPNYRVFFGNERCIDVPADRAGLNDIFETLEEGSSARLDEYLKIAKKEYDIAMKDFMYRDYRSPLDFVSWRTIKEGTKLHLLESIDAFAKRYFSNKQIRQILEYTMVFLGGSPHNTPALYAIMSHVDFNLGVWYPMGGMGEVVKAFVQLARSCGAEIVLNEPVSNIEVDKNVKANRVITSRAAYDCDCVVVNADYHHAETQLLEKRMCVYSEKYWEKRVMGPSAYLLYLGFDTRIPGLLHHNLYLEPDWENHFDSIFKHKKWPDEFSYYVCCPSKTDGRVAPKGGENIFVLVPVAADLDDTDEIRGKYFSIVMDRLERMVGKNLRDHLIVKRMYAHRNFCDDYNAYKGTALGMSHTLRQTAVFRPAHRSKKVQNLYYTGNYTHPGVGVPMVIISAQIVCDEIEREHGP
jgi:phytoene desaturase